MGNCNQLTVVVPMWMEQIGESYIGDQELQEIITEVFINKWGPQQYYLQQGLLKYQGRWVIGSTGELRYQIFEELHCNDIGGHSGNRATYNRIKDYFFWSTIRQDIRKWVRECEICQQVKGEHVKAQGCLF